MSAASHQPRDGGDHLGRAIYLKYYGAAYIARIVALMFVAMVAAALTIDALFGAASLIPTGPRPTRTDIFGTMSVDYKLALNVLGLLIFAAFFWLSGRRASASCHDPSSSALPAECRHEPTAWRSGSADRVHRRFARRA